MPFAAPMTRGVKPATMNGLPIPEIGVAPDIRLDDMGDVHFGMNLDKKAYPYVYMDLDRGIIEEKELIGLGLRTVDIVRRGGRTAEDDWILDTPGATRARGKMGMDSQVYGRFNRQIPIKKDGSGNKILHYPDGAKKDNKNISQVSRKKYFDDNLGGNKDSANHVHRGVRWSKTALEYALARGSGNIHFHLHGMGELSQALDPMGCYAYNVTSQELRYVKRFWKRFQFKVVFYNGYEATSLLPVMVVPPWLPSWKPSRATKACTICGRAFDQKLSNHGHHHCRLCGKSVCSDCSPQRAFLKHPVVRANEISAPGSFRVCDPCFKAFDRGAPSTF